MEVKTTLLEQLRALRLPAFREGFEETARKAMQETLTYEQYLLELTHQECDERRARRIERMLRESRLPLEKTLIIAPHPDDESIAAAGLMQRALAAGGDVRVLFVTDGDNNPWPLRFLVNRL